MKTEKTGLKHCSYSAPNYSGGFITAIVVNPPENKLSKRTSVHWFTVKHSKAGLQTSSNPSKLSLPFAWITGPATDPSSVLLVIVHFELS